MVLVDTSVWVAHFREGNDRLRAALDKGEVLSHPFVIGELACGNLENRREILDLLQSLPRAAAVSDEEVRRFIELRRLMGIGLGYIDVHLLASALVTGVPLWSLDRTLHKTAERLSVSYKAD
jgi:predicted nucleic acid-binding protein